MASAIRQIGPTQQARGGPLERGRGTPYTLVVVGLDAADIVCGAGGLVCDAVHAGVRVEVYAQSVGGEQALRIIGVAAETLPARFSFEAQWPDAVFFSGRLHDRNQALRRLVTDTVRRRNAEIASWEAPGSSQRDLTVAIEHRLSYAAQAFKHYAVKAVGRDQLAGTIEAFSGVGRPRGGVAPAPWR